MENLKCLITYSFPWDIFLAWALPMLLLWWLMNRWLNRYKSHAEELQSRINFLESELDACRKNRVSASADVDVNTLKARITRLEADLDACNKSKLAAGAVASAGVSAPIASLAATEPAKRDDLKIVEGIGPKIEELCHQAGIYTFADLANASYETLKTILDNAGPRFQIHDPGTWPKQAALARDGKWDELKAWQEELNKGRE